MPSLFVRRYYPIADRPLIQSWLDYHAGGPVKFPRVPPLGVVVELDGVPSLALWCYECVGIDVAFLELPLSRAGLSRQQLTTAGRFAWVSLMELAGKDFDPPGIYRLFRCTGSPAVARVLASWGFIRESSGEMIPMYFTTE